MNEKQTDVVENCRFAAGLSLGEYTALFFAGVMEFRDALRVVAERGAAMQAASDATPSGMVSILGLEREQHRTTLPRLCPGRSSASGQYALPRQHRRLRIQSRLPAH